MVHGYLLVQFLCLITIALRSRPCLILVIRYHKSTLVRPTLHFHYPHNLYFDIFTCQGYFTPHNQSLFTTISPPRFQSGGVAARIAAIADSIYNSAQKH